MGEAGAEQSRYLETIAKFQVRDLTEAARAGHLEPAFEVDDRLAQLSAILESGRNPIISGPGGVGRSALVHELVRRQVAGRGVAPLEGMRVVEFSFAHIRAAAKTVDDIHPSMRALVDAILAVGDDLVPWFSDFPACYDFDVEPLMYELAMGFANPILGEGDSRRLKALFEYTPYLLEYFVIVPTGEPDHATTRRILRQWGAAQTLESGEAAYLPEAIDEAVNLSDRFLTRARQPRKAVELLKQTRGLTEADKPVTSADVIDYFCKRHGVPRVLIDPSMPLDIAEIERGFEHNVLGQPEAVQAVVRVACLIKAGLSPRTRPFASLLFVGPTGVGKTYLARMLAAYLFGSEERVIRFNMADYAQDGDAARLFGTREGPPNLRYGELTERLSGHPFGILLLDEFEKAARGVHDRFLQLLDEGLFINGAGAVVSCRSLIIIATSNQGAETYRKHIMGFGARPGDMPTMKREVDRALMKRFRFELLNRFDQIIHFTPLSREDVRTIARRELEKIRARTGFQQRGYKLEVDDVVLDWLTAHGYDPEHGARYLLRTVERHATTALAEAMVRSVARSGTTFRLTVRRNRIVATTVGPSPIRRERERVVLPLGKGDQVRALDRTHLLAEAENVLHNATRRLETFELRKAEAAQLLDKINREGLWGGAGGDLDIIERYRELDVIIQTGERLAAPLRELEAVRQEARARDYPLESLARSVEEAARAIREWDERLAENGAGAVWVLLSKVDPLLPATRWLTDLSAMELAWCQRLEFHASVVACQYLDGELSRVAIEVEGPGAGAILAMEHGVHRLVRSQASDLRVRVEVVPRTVRAVAPWPRMRRIKKRRGPFEISLTASARLEIPDRGIVLELLGGDEQALGHLITDLRSYFTEQTAPTDAARIYGLEGAGARDPRTGATIARSRNVLKGDLDRLLDAWRAWQDDGG